MSAATATEPGIQTALAVARTLVGFGVPVFVARPALRRDGTWDPASGHNGCGYWLPTNWQQTVPSLDAVDAWRPGMALCALMGHGLDLLDVDDRNGGRETRTGLLSAGMWPRAYGVADTPSGGTHEFVAGLGVRSRDAVQPGLDVKAGVADGVGRGFAFIAPTVKLSKTTGEIAAYRWTSVPDPDVLADAHGDDSGGEVAELVRRAHGSNNGSQSPQDGATDPGGARKWLVAEPIPVGSRYPWLRSYAGWLRHNDTRLAEALTLVRERWEACEQPASYPMPWTDAEALLRDIYARYAPRAVDLLAVQVTDADQQDGITPVLLEEFWRSRPELDHVRQFALARMCSPFAVLGIVLLRVLSTVPPWVVLPAIIGGPGSLNVHLAVVGRSGVGKGAADAAAQGAVDVGADVYTAPVGSGEGLAHQYAHREKQSLIRDRDAVLFSVAEVDTLTALGSRQGATLLTQLRSAFSGERLGFGYADPIKRLPLEPHTYRLGLVLGVQPERAGPLLDDADGGTPQRFVWTPGTDPAVTADPPTEPAPLKLQPQPWHRPRWDAQLVLPLPAAVARTIREAHAARVAGSGDALDGHALFAREKIAVALTLLAGRRVVTEDDWRLSAVVMKVSDQTRRGVVATLATVRAEQNEARGKAEARRAVVVSETVTEAAVRRVAARVVNHLRGHGPTPRSEERRRFSSDDRGHFDEALDRLVGAGQVAVEQTAQGERLMLTEVVQ